MNHVTGKCCWPSWSQFLRSQAEAILACDFFTAELLDGTQAYVLAVIEHATRHIRILRVTLHPTGEWTTLLGRRPDWAPAGAALLLLSAAHRSPLMAAAHEVRRASPCRVLEDVGRRP